MPKTKLNLDKLISRTKIYLVVIAIILVILCVVEPKAIIPSILYGQIIREKQKSRSILMSLL